MRQEAILLAGALPGEAAGNSVSTETLLQALLPYGRVGLLTHEISPLPRAVWNGGEVLPTVCLGAQPICVHGEAALAGWLNRKRLRTFTYGWAVNSRYAGALRAARIPYLIWEPTTLHDELAITTVAAVRRSRSGTGIGVLLHKALLPFDERIERSIYRSAYKVLAMSEYTAERIRSLHGLDDNKVRVLAHPPTPAFMASLERVRTVPRRQRELGEPLRLLFVGRVDDPRKNFELLRQAFLFAAADGLLPTLTVIGPHRDDWRRSMHLDAEPRVRFLGRVSEDVLSSALLDHDVLIVSSRQEGFGIVVAEAMHAGLPIIATRCGGPEHVLRESGAGILVDHSPNALAAAIRALASDAPRRAAMGKCAREYAERELSTARFGQRVGEELSALREAASVTVRV